MGFMSTALASRPATRLSEPTFPVERRAELADAGFTALRSVIPDDLIADCRSVMETWVETMVAKWRSEGRLAPGLPETGDFRRRFLDAWHAAGRPGYHRSPRTELIHLDPQRMFRILAHPALVELAAQALGSDEIVSHGIWNSRPKAPDQQFTDTPWHQDVQYFPEQQDVRMLNLWFPLHDVDGDSSCLAFAPGRHRQGIFTPVQNHAGTGFLGMTDDDLALLTTVPVPLDAGDAVAFGIFAPHRAMPNRTALMRWSMDLRFCRREDATEQIMEQGFVVRSADRSQLTPYDAWRAKWG